MHYMITATTDQRYLNDQNRICHDYDRSTLIGNSLDELYERIAKFRIDNETPEDEREYDDYRTVEFGDIRVIFDSIPFDMNELENTELWKNHIKQLEEKKQQEETEERLLNEERAKQLLEIQRAQYEALKKQFEGE